MKVIAVVIGLLAVTSPAAAQFEGLAFNICKKVPTDTARLKCFDEIGAKTGGPAADEPRPVRGKWVYTESASPVDDSPQLMAVMAGDPDDAALIFRCRENKTEAIFLPGSFFFASGRADVLMRINSEPPETLSWSVGTNNKALFISPAPDFIRLLPDNGKLFLRATGFQGKQADGIFNLADVSVARDRIADTCRWSTPKTAKAKK